ncbi:hypothetical protein XENTR_v10020800 [Xenopus tropicalis]|uniref:immunoglobulin-binding protein 1 n=1 Tax=Xenopus tropicalis TaxID=8364 RepID=UPI0000DD4C31|eukprot:NP_001072440.1 immunoglobulin-binding protein 1 [Xenopus tropicalis]
MAEATEPEPAKLSELLVKGWRFLDEVEESNEPTGAHELQDKVKRGIGSLEQATRMVTQLELFSRNEDLEEISSTDIKYLLLPALLGALTLKQTGLSKRLQHLEAARSYFLDFLTRCHDYKVSKFELPQQTAGTSQGEQETFNMMRPTPAPGLTAMAVQRQAKIERYKQKKELESRLSGLQEAVRSGSADEEQVREFYLLQLQRWVCTALEEIDSIDQELPMVKAREAIKKGAEIPHPSRPTRPPMKPFILTRDALQAKVFGAGYPSLPTMTVDDWYEQHQKKGILPDQGVHSKPTDEEQEAALKERKEEQDDPETLQRARNWDDWKDTHPRGYGNRKNMG